MSNKKLHPDLLLAQTYLDTLEAEGEFTFQTFPDDNRSRASHLTRVLHGKLKHHAKQLSKLNQQGAGIFVTVNKTDLLGRSKNNVTGVRAVFVDLDGSPLKPIITHTFEPHMIIESSKDRWHAFWLVDKNFCLTDFSDYQERLAKKFDGDHQVKDLPRVMRLPGFYHNKPNKDGTSKEPFMTKIEQLETLNRRNTKELASAFPLVMHDLKGAKTGIKNQKNFSDEELERALYYLDPSDRSVWIKVGLALKSVGVKFFDIYLRWSRGNLTGNKPPNFVSEDDVSSTWESFKPDTIGLGSIFLMANECGYKAKHTEAMLSHGSTVECANLMRKKLSKDGVAPIYCESNFYLFETSVWVPVSDSAMRKYVHELEGVRCTSGKVLKLSTSLITGILTELLAICDKPDFFSNSPVGVTVKNGFLTLNNGELSIADHAPSDRQRHVIDAQWNPIICGEPPVHTQTLFDGLFGAEDYSLRNLILEVIGTILLGTGTNLKSPKSIVLFGPTASNGKSTLLKLIRRLLPKSAVCSISPADFEKEQSLAVLIGKKANLSDELSSSKSIASDKMKAVVTGDEIIAKILYKNPINFSPKAVHIFATNMLPIFAGGVDLGIERRMLVVPFDNTIQEKDRITNIVDLIIKNEGDYLLSEAAKAGAQALKKGSYTIPARCIAATEQWLKEADPVREWYLDGGLNHHVDKKAVSIQDLYKNFIEDIKDNEDSKYMPGKRRFIQQIRALLSRDPEWNVVRLSEGVCVCRALLV